MSPLKHYADCGIQTDDFSSVNQSLCEPQTFQPPVGHSCIVTGSDVPSTESDITLANGSLVFESAYNQSPDSTSLLSSRHCVGRFTGILYGRPSEPRLYAKKRVLSLTSNSPTGKFKASTLGDKLRLVSMPERGKYAGVLAKDSLLEKRCIDDAMDDTTSDHEQAERPYPADLPQTPSPPSSPESVTIIGNNTHVPGSFLRRPEHTDEDGWVSWANSPPRPIPALHGPSSLPYARCPSGAEGTLVEGDDLCHKIWGLGIDDSQLALPPTITRPSVCRASKSQDYCPSQAPPTTAVSQDEFALSHYYERDTVIDLSRPATFYGHVGTQRVLSKQNVENFPISTSRQTRIPQLADVESFAALRAKNLRFEEVYKVGHPSILAVGLGLHTWSSQGSRLENVSPIREISSNPLNTTAPIFVPASANMEAYPSKRRSEKPLPFSAPRRPLIFNKQPDAQSLLPTPPSTSSPCWTPIFSHQPEMAISKPMLNSKISKVDPYSPNIYSPISDLEDDSSHIRTIMQQNAAYETDITYSSKVDPQTRSFQKDSFQVFLHELDSSQIDVSSCLNVNSGSLYDPFMAFSTNHENSPHDGKLLQAEPLQPGVGMQDSTKRRHDLSHQQPRSIPLARLIQRRLSSVAEEDLSTKILFPFLQEATPKGEFTRSKGLSLEPLGRQMPRIGLLDEEIFTTEIFSLRTEPDHQLVYEAESMPSSDESNIVVKLPQKATTLHHVDREQKILRYGKVTRQTTFDTKPASDASRRHQIRVKKQSTAITITDDT